MRARATFPLLLAGALYGSIGTAAPLLEEAPGSTIGYPSVSAALDAVRAKAGVQIQELGGWIIVSDTEAGHPVFWAFTPASDHAYPAVVKRELVQKEAGTDVQMNVLCEADKASCDALVREFQALNERAVGALRGGAPSGDVAGRGSATESINITPDSAPGWLPSAEQRKQAPAAAYAFLGALDTRDYKKAYGLMADLQQQHTKFGEFAQRSADFNRLAGAVKERRITKVTWTKDPAQAPAPGIYAAIDLRSRFANVDRHCGYLMLYQPDPATPFKVMRQEDNFMSNADALKISEQKSAGEVERLWAQVSGNCPK